MPLAQLPPRRILVVDDDKAHADELATQLRKVGHTVEIANDGQAALELERTFGPEMVIIELALSGMDALSVARSLRAQANRDLMLVSVVFGECKDHDRADFEACFDDHVNKLHGVPVLMRGRMKLADISPEDWMLDQRLLSREDFALELLSAVTARPHRPRFAPDELAPLIPDEVLRELRRLAASPTDLANYVAHGVRPKQSGKRSGKRRGQGLRRVLTEDQGNIVEGASRWLSFFNP